MTISCGLNYSILHDNILHSVISKKFLTHSFIQSLTEIYIDHSDNLSKQVNV